MVEESSQQNQHSYYNTEDEDTTNGGEDLDDSTSRHYDHDETNLQETPAAGRKMPDKETAVVWCTKALAIFVLIVSAGTAGGLTYSLLAGNEQEDFEDAVSAVLS